MEKKMKRRQLKTSNTLKSIVDESLFEVDIQVIKAYQMRSISNASITR